MTSYLNMHAMMKQYVKLYPTRTERVANAYINSLTCISENTYRDMALALSSFK